MNDLIFKILLATVVIAIGGLPVIYRNKSTAKDSVKSHANKIKDLCKPHLKEKQHE